MYTIGRMSVYIMYGGMLYQRMNENVYFEGMHVYFERKNLYPYPEWRRYCVYWMECINVQYTNRMMCGSEYIEWNMFTVSTN